MVDSTTSDTKIATEMTMPSGRSLFCAAMQRLAHRDASLSVSLVSALAHLFTHSSASPESKYTLAVKVMGDAYQGSKSHRHAR